MNRRFIAFADWISYAMGTPANIAVWLAIVVGWILLFALHLLSANATVLPAWFTGPAFNFPLNTVTTLAELYIGFLIAAAANRVQRRQDEVLAALRELGERDYAINVHAEEEISLEETQIVQIAAALADLLTDRDRRE